MKGWGAQDDFQAQIAQTIADAQAAVQVQLMGKGQDECEDCETPIPDARRKAYPAAIRCVKCQSIFEMTHFRR